MTLLLNFVQSSLAANQRLSYHEAISTWYSSNILAMNVFSKFPDIQTRRWSLFQHITFVQMGSASELIDQLSDLDSWAQIWKKLQSMDSLKTIDCDLIITGRISVKKASTTDTPMTDPPTTDEDFARWLQPLKSVSSVPAVRIFTHQVYTDRFNEKKRYYGLHNVTFKSRS